ncbi:lysine transporter LysE [Hypericibacter adhaerens]|jgi:threonine/homoserine/homoserine lactone efflux protein|uniref:Lysine transporter LysE n=1 Tax=Hypericibacter adhaerens TaxID=2602016 RepID=A0A5J6MTB4_9PROT|nr:LysE family translocator [Hypericibacter adhaerens]QEX20589.1 lysine transporter LysE [Hypericibacter adhaerens]
MSLHVLLIFAATYLVACALPGPTVTALVARVIGKGTHGAFAFCTGLMAGELIWVASAMFGLALLAALFQPVFVAIRYLGAAYLLYLAWKLWTAPAAEPGEGRVSGGEGVRLFLGGFALTMGNPKTMLFYLALLPTLIDLAHVTVGGFLEIALTVSAIYSVVMAGYVLLAARARRAFRSRRAMRLVNRVTGGVMAGAAVAVATRN